MDRRDKTPGTKPRHGVQAGEAKLGGQTTPAETEKPRKASTGIPGRDDAAEPAEARQSEPSEDFGARRDIETADKPAEEHDRRHHDRNRLDEEAGRPF